jgi:hypothetical protein
VPNKPIVYVIGVLSADGWLDAFELAADVGEPVSDACGDDPVDEEQPASATAATTAAPMSACRLLRAMDMDPSCEPSSQGSS